MYSPVSYCSYSHFRVPAKSARLHVRAARAIGLFIHFHLLELKCIQQLSSSQCVHRVLTEDMMATTVYADCQQLCDYALLKHVDVGKDVDAPEKLYKVSA